MAGTRTPTVDFDAALDATTTVHPKGGKVTAALASLPDDQRSKVERALADRTVSSERIAEALTVVVGSRIGRASVDNYRKGGRSA